MQSRYDGSSCDSNLSAARRTACALSALAVGAGLMYMFDPVRGRERRSLIRDKARGTANRSRIALRKTAEYFQEEGMSGIVEDLELLIRRYPLQTLLLGMGCGYLLSRLRSE